MRPRFRLLTLADVPELASLERLCFSAPWTENMFRNELDNDFARYWVLEEDGRLVGYGGYWLIAGEVHITNIAVHPDYRRRGYGRRLVRNLIQLARNYRATGLTLEARPSNTAALALYESEGFERRGERPHYYEDNGEAAVIMWLNLTYEDDGIHPWSE